jgi:hypothetical protein
MPRFYQTASTPAKDTRDGSSLAINGSSERLSAAHIRADTARLGLLRLCRTVIRSNPPPAGASR